MSRRPCTCLAVAVTLALAGCGGSSGSDKSSQAKPAGSAYARAVSGLDTLRGGRLNARLVLSLKGGGTDRLVESERAVFGALDGVTLPPFIAVVAAQSASGGSQRAEVIHTGRAFY